LTYACAYFRGVEAMLKTLTARVEQVLKLLEKTAGRLIIITLALVECYKYVRWLLEH
jgi:hypothetical protein